MYESHLDFLIHRPRPVSCAGDLKSHKAVVNHTVFRREALQELKPDITH